MVTYQDKLPYSIPAGNAAHAKQSQQLRLQYLSSLIYQGHIKSLQTEQFGLGRQRSDRSHKNSATRHALLHLPACGARLQHVFYQMRTIHAVTGKFTADTYEVDLRCNGCQHLTYLVHCPVSI